MNVSSENESRRSAAGVGGVTMSRISNLGIAFGLGAVGSIIFVIATCIDLYNVGSAVQYLNFICSVFLLLFTVIGLGATKDNHSDILQPSDFETLRQLRIFLQKSGSRSQRLIRDPSSPRLGASKQIASFSVEDISQIVRDAGYTSFDVKLEKSYSLGFQHVDDTTNSGITKLPSDTPAGTQYFVVSYDAKDIIPGSENRRFNVSPGNRIATLTISPEHHLQPLYIRYQFPENEPFGIDSEDYDV